MEKKKKCEIQICHEVYDIRDNINTDLKNMKSSKKKKKRMQ